MPIQQTQGVFNTGRDCTFVLIGPFGRVDIQNVTGFDVKQETVALKSDRLDGVQMNAELPKGWTGSFECDRGDPTIDNLFSAIESAWMNGGAYQVSTMFQYINESGGGTSAYAYDNVALKLTDAGSWKPDAVVKQTVAFTANRRRPV